MVPQHQLDTTVSRRVLHPPIKHAKFTSRKRASKVCFPRIGLVIESWKAPFPVSDLNIFRFGTPGKLRQTESCINVACQRQSRRMEYPSGTVGTIPSCRRPFVTCRIHTYLYHNSIFPGEHHYGEQYSN